MKFSVLIFFLISLTTFSQSLDHTAIGLSYRYINRNVAQISVEQLIYSKNSNSLIVGGSAMYTSVDGKSKILPEIHSYFIRECLFAGISLNSYALEPRVGISILNAFYFTSGYAFPIEKNEYFKGITFGIQWNLGLGKPTEFYNKMKLF